MPAYLRTDQRYISSLAGWRGIISLFVILFHAYVLFATEPLVPFAYLGVDFFFILSGFFITRQYEMEAVTHAIRLKKFALRRLARLYPLYIVSIILMLVINSMIIEPNAPGVRALDIAMGPMIAVQTFAQLSMLGNLGLMNMPWNGPAWSVSVEWIVNLLFFMLAWRLRHIGTFLWVSLIAICLTYLMWISPQSLNLVFANIFLVNPTLARGILGFAIGALIFRYHTHLPSLSFWMLHLLDVMLVVALAVILLYYEKGFIVGLDYILVVALFPPLIILSLYKKSWIAQCVSLPPFVFLGKISYSIYLLNLPLFYAFQYSPMIRNLHLTLPYSGLYFMLLVIVLSTVSYFVIEVPCRAFGRRLAN